jgi:signal transduction histidine kinase/CheY-like chemotaxis protein
MSVGSSNGGKNSTPMAQPDHIHPVPAAPATATSTLSEDLSRLELQPLRVLLVEDSEDDATLVMRALRQGGYEVRCERVDTSAAMSTALTGGAWDVVISDYAMPRFSGLGALTLLQDMGLDVPFILVSGTIGEDVAVRAMKAGAHDYIMKGNLARLVPAVQRELRDAEVRRERKRVEAAWREEAELSAALARVASDLIVLLDTPRILDHLCELTAQVLACDASHTFLLQPEDRVYVPVSNYGDSAEQWEALRVVSIPEAALGLRSRLEQDEVVQLQMAAAQDEGIRGLPAPLARSAALVVALRRGPEIIGILSASYRGGAQRFTPQQERIARGIGQLASMALATARLVEELDRANRIKADFVATMSHELRTPLNVIIGYHDLLIGGDFGALQPDQLDVLQRADKSARELLQLITATLDLSRLEAGQLPVEQRDISLRHLVDEIAGEARVAWVKPGVAFNWQVPTELPRVRTDPLKLKVVLKNLIANAVKFTEQGTVTVGARRCEAGIEISVADTGVGIAPQTLPIIFEPFRQGDASLTRPYGGVGLGLYIVRRLVDVLGATINVESTVGSGSTFRVRVPAQPPPPAA